MGNTKAIESIRKIQLAAKERVQARLAQKGVTLPVPVPAVQVPALSKAERTEILRKTKRKFHATLATSIAEQFDSLKRSVVNNLKGKTGEVISEILPNNCRFYQMGENSGALILEYAPTKRIVHVGQDHGRNKGGTRNVAFPYFYFYVSFNKQGGFYNIVQRGVGARNSPLSSIDDSLGALPLPHTQGNLHVCQPMKTNQFRTIKDLAEEFVASFWQSRFVYEFEAFTVGKQRVKSWADWEKIDVLEMLKVKLENGTSVKDLLKIHTRYDNDVHVRNTLQGNVSKSENAIQTAIKNAVEGFNWDEFADSLTSDLQD